MISFYDVSLVVQKCCYTILTRPGLWMVNIIASSRLCAY
jgi:hypothetical protein